MSRRTRLDPDGTLLMQQRRGVPNARMWSEAPFHAPAGWDGLESEPDYVSPSFPQAAWMSGFQSLRTYYKYGDYFSGDPLMDVGHQWVLPNDHGALLPGDEVIVPIVASGYTFSVGSHFTPIITGGLGGVQWGIYRAVWDDSLDGWTVTITGNGGHTNGSGDITWGIWVTNPLIWRNLNRAWRSRLAHEALSVLGTPFPARPATSNIALNITIIMGTLYDTTTPTIPGIAHTDWTVGNGANYYPERPVSGVGSGRWDSVETTKARWIDTPWQTAVQSFDKQAYLWPSPAYAAVVQLWADG